MVDYYKILGLTCKADASEIKSAYRKLARKRHPDVSDSEHAAREFALVSDAYRTLIDPQSRAYYDSQRTRLSANSSVFTSDNPHAFRMKRVAVQSKWDKAVDLCLEAERQETLARTQAVFTTVSLFLSTFIVAVLKPRFWESFDGFAGRAVLLTLFAIGLWHLAIRLRDYFQRYTYQPKQLLESIINETDEETKPFTRSSALAFLLIGSGICMAAGLYVGIHTHYIVEDLAVLFDHQAHFDLLFYPPIAVLIVDTMQTVASKID